MAIVRDVARQQRVAEAARDRAIREADRAAKRQYREARYSQRETARTLKEFERQEKARYISEREQEVADLSAGLAETHDRLGRILPGSPHPPISCEPKLRPEKRIILPVLLLRGECSRGCPERSSATNDPLRRQGRNMRRL